MNYSFQVKKFILETQISDKEEIFSLKKCELVKTLDAILTFDTWNNFMPYQTIEGFKSCLTENTTEVSSFKISCGCEDRFEYDPDNKINPCQPVGLYLDVENDKTVAMDYTSFSNCHSDIDAFMNPNPVAQKPKRFVIENNGEVSLNFQNITGVTGHLKLNFDRNTPNKIVEKICVNLGYAKGVKSDKNTSTSTRKNANKNNGKNDQLAFNYGNSECRAILNKILDDEPLTFNQLIRLLSDKSQNCNKLINNKDALHIECISHDGITITHTPVPGKPKFNYIDLEEKHGGISGSLTVNIGTTWYYLSLHSLGGISDLYTIKKSNILCKQFGYKKAKKHQVEWTNLSPSTPRVYIPDFYSGGKECQHALEKALLGHDIDIIFFERYCTISDGTENLKFYSLICVDGDDDDVVDDVDADDVDEGIIDLSAEDMMNFVTLN